MLRLCLLVAAVCVGSSTGNMYSTKDLPHLYSDRIKPSDYLVKLHFRAKGFTYDTMLESFLELQGRLFKRFHEYNVASKEKISLTGIGAATLEQTEYSEKDEREAILA